MIADMDVFRLAERSMSMDDKSWRRHANPWSGWTRMLALPLLCIAVWSRFWIGLWAILPIALAIGFIWINPRLFSEPSHFRAWMSRGVLGERVFLEHRKEIPAHHRKMAHLLSGLSVPGVVLMIWGLAVFWWEGVVFGAFLASVTKIWFVDRMVWILQDWRSAGNAVPGMDDNEL